MKRNRKNIHPRRSQTYKSRFFTAALAVTIVAMASVAAPGDPVGPPCDPSFASDKLFVS